MADQEKDRTLEVLMGRVIRFHRKALDLSQEELAGRCGLSRHAIQQYERGKREPKTSVLIQLARGLEVPIETLIHQTTWNPPEVGREGRLEHRPDAGYPALPPGADRANPNEAGEESGSAA